MKSSRKKKKRQKNNEILRLTERRGDNREKLNYKNWTKVLQRRKKKQFNRVKRRNKRSWKNNRDRKRQIKTKRSTLKISAVK